MWQLWYVWFAGMGISFLGQLPLGNMNLTATQLSVQENFRNAWKFGVGIVLIEIVYLRLALTGMDWVVKNQPLFQLLGWITVVVFIALGLIAFLQARKQQATQKGLLINNNLDRFLLGLLASAMNPVQIPFWFLWSTQMLDADILQPFDTQFNLFTVGAGIGSLLGLAVYIHGGKWIIEKINASNKSLNVFMGIVFVLAGLYQLYNMLSGN